MGAKNHVAHVRLPVTCLFQETAPLFVHICALRQLGSLRPPRTHARLHAGFWWVWGDMCVSTNCNPPQSNRNCYRSDLCYATQARPSTALDLHKIHPTYATCFIHSGAGSNSTHSSCERAIIWIFVTAVIEQVAVGKLGLSVHVIAWQKG